MPDITAAGLYAALRTANDERPEALSARMSVVGERGEPVRFLKVEGQVDLERLAELLNRHYN